MERIQPGFCRVIFGKPVRVLGANEGTVAVVQLGVLLNGMMMCEDDRGLGCGDELIMSISSAAGARERDDFSLTCGHVMEVFVLPSLRS